MTTIHPTPTMVPNARVKYSLPRSARRRVVAEPIGSIESLLITSDLGAALAVGIRSRTGAVLESFIDPGVDNIRQRNHQSKTYVTSGASKE
jgi:hypothetical protein